MVGSLTVLPALLSSSATGSTGAACPFVGRGSPRRRPRLGADHRRASCAGPAVVLVAGGALLVARASRARHAHEAPEPDRPAAGPRRRADLQPHPARVPGRATPAVVVVKADDVDRRRSAARTTAVRARARRDRRCSTRRSRSASARTGPSRAIDIADRRQRRRPARRPRRCRRCATTSIPPSSARRRRRGRRHRQRPAHTTSTTRC